MSPRCASMSVILAITLWNRAAAGTAAALTGRRWARATPLTSVGWGVSMATKRWHGLVYASTCAACQAPHFGTISALRHARSVFTRWRSGRHAGICAHPSSRLRDETHTQGQLMGLFVDWMRVGQRCTGMSRITRSTSSPRSSTMCAQWAPNPRSVRSAATALYA